MPPRPRRYRHRKTQTIVTQSPSGFYTAGDLYLLAAMVEDSPDWESLNPAFTTEDGVDIFPGQGWYYVVLDNDNTPSKAVVPVFTTTLKYNGTNVKPVLRFSTLEIANKWLDRNRKRLSYAELKEQATKFKLSEASLKALAKYLNIK